MPPHVWGVLALGLVTFGSSAILVRFASEAPGLALVAWRTGLVAAFLAPFALKRAGREMRRLGRRDWALVAASGVVLGLHFIGYVESLYRTSVASASVLVTSSPLFIALLGFVVLGERLPLRTVGAIGAGVAGAALIGLADAAGGDFPRAASGNALALSAALLGSVYLLIGRAVRQRVSFLAYFFPVCACAALTALGVALAQGVPLGQPPRILLLCALMALGPGLLGHGAFNYAVRYVPAAGLGLLTLGEPLLASGLAFALFAERPPPLALVGMGVVMAAIAAVFIWPLWQGRAARAARLPD